LDNLIIVNGKIIDKPHFLINENDIVKIVEKQKYVSRGAYKLLAAIQH
jgi:23S rRNA (cytidine1920-2'-O)/16S rRNA (cytidine1409-2'-O)-methyltransferase